MHGLSVEYRQICSIPLSRDLARQIKERSLYGKVVVVAENPASCLSAVRKQWLQIIRSTQIERARTLHPERVGELVQELARLQTTIFSAKTTSNLLGKDVVFATAKDLAHLAPACPTLFVTYSFPREQLHLMTSWMPRSGLVVVYK